MDFSGSLNKKKTKALFYNAQDDPEVLKTFGGLQNRVVVAKKEVREEAPKVNPFQHLEDRNAELAKIRNEAALRSDATQTLVKGPKPLIEKETVSLEDLPHIVRQAAESALLRAPALRTLPSRRR
jgi:hypothetical protein